MPNLDLLSQQTIYNSPKFDNISYLSDNISNTRKTNSRYRRRHDIRYHSSTGFESVEVNGDAPSPHRSSVASRLRFFEQLSNKSTFVLVG